MREPKNKLQRAVAGYLEIPREIALDLPKLTVVGDVQALLENHRGLIEYAADKIRVSTRLGEIELRGVDLVLKNIFPDEIMVEGKISSIDLWN